MPGLDKCSQQHHGAEQRALDTMRVGRKAHGVPSSWAAGGRDYTDSITKPQRFK
jgi:hypothetical protein